MPEQESRLLDSRPALQFRCLSEITPTEARDWRNLANMTLKEVARRSHVSIAQVCQYERGTLPLKPEQKRRVKQVLMAEILSRADKIAAIASKPEARSHREKDRDCDAVGV